ncbi:hypothetical protein BDP67DRAFT_494401 [Colletotrichum lupini]|nr:hypothetical protein BDP67DRAFT_494401 [Colletotrichum lupini]
MINPIIPMQVRVHSETGLSTPGPKQQDARQKDASTHSKTTSPSLTVGHAEKPQSQQESEPGLAAVARPKERDYLTGFGTLGRYGKGKSPTSPNISFASRRLLPSIPSITLGEFIEPDPNEPGPGRETRGTDNYMPLLSTYPPMHMPARCRLR